jgi:Mg-chelatase subunit ChlD
MSGKGRRFLPVLVSLLLSLTLALAATPPAARAETAPGPLRADVVLLLDRSGSMAGNDPTGLGPTGAEVFLGMLDPNDRVAVIAFDTGARTLLPLSPVGDGSAARMAIKSMGKPTGQWTDIKGALTAALDQLGPGAGGPAAGGQAAEDQTGQTQAEPVRQPAVVLFTDGKPETQPGGVPAGYRDQMAREISRLAGRNIPVFSVGLGQADFDTLNQIALGTKAESFAATSSAQIVQLFTDVLSRIKERQLVVGYSEDLAPGKDGKPHTFQVPPYTRLLTLSGVGAGGVSLKGQMPGGAALDAAPGVKITRGGNYVVYTIPNPPPGAWVVQLQGTGRVEAHGQAESALRLELISPQPYSQVDQAGPVPVSVEVTGDPDPQSPLEVWAQAGAGAPVRLERTAGGAADGSPRYEGRLPMADGHLAIWAARAGSEVARREFRVYPVAATSATSPSPPKPAPAATAGGQVGPPTPPPLARKLALAAAAVIAGVAALLLAGAWRWRRLRRREELLTGRLGGQSLAGRGRVQPIGDLATLEARLVARGPTALAGLGFVPRRTQVFIIRNPGVRLEINGRPPGDGRLYHGDEVTLGGETLVYQNPQAGRRPAAAAGKPRRTGPGRPRPHTTIKG